MVYTFCQQSNKIPPSRTNGQVQMQEWKTLLLKFWDVQIFVVDIDMVQALKIIT